MGAPVSDNAEPRNPPEVLPPFDEIADLLHDGDVIPFLGAGVNTRPDPRQNWSPGAPFLPRGAELSRYLAKRYQIPAREDPERADLAKVSSYGAEVMGRDRLRARLRDVFAREYLPCPIHDYLAEIDQPLLIVTTNYDDLAEQAFARRGKPYHLVVHPTDRSDSEAAILWWPPGAGDPVVEAANSLPLKPGADTIIYKMHGSVYRWPAGTAEAEPRRNGAPGQGIDGTPPAGRADPGRLDSFVITEDDYVDFLSRMVSNTAIPVHFVPYFHHRPFLFLGYGLGDWNLRVMLRNLGRVLPDGRGDQPAPPRTRRSWAIQFEPSPMEKELWRSRGVRIFDMDIDRFVHRLRHPDLDEEAADDE